MSGTVTIQGSLATLNQAWVQKVSAFGAVIERHDGFG